MLAGRKDARFIVAHFECEVGSIDGESPFCEVLAVDLVARFLRLEGRYLLHLLLGGRLLLFRRHREQDLVDLVGSLDKSPLLPHSEHLTSLFNHLRHVSFQAERFSDLPNFGS